MKRNHSLKRELNEVMDRAPEHRRVTLSLDPKTYDAFQAKVGKGAVSRHVEGFMRLFLKKG